jgi:hypothetical protein
MVVGGKEILTGRVAGLNDGINSDQPNLPFFLPNFISSKMSDIQALLAALDVFARAPDKAQLETANSWLQDFQHSVSGSFTYNQRFSLILLYVA